MRGREGGSVAGGGVNRGNFFSRGTCFCQKKENRRRELGSRGVRPDGAVDRPGVGSKRDPKSARPGGCDEAIFQRYIRANAPVCTRWSGRVRFRETSAGSPISRNKSPRVTLRLWRHGCGATNDGPRVAGSGVRYGVFLPKRWFNRRAGCAFTVSARCQCANPLSPDPLRSSLRKYLKKKTRELGKLSQPRTVKSRSEERDFSVSFSIKLTSWKPSWRPRGIWGAPKCDLGYKIVGPG